MIPFISSLQSYIRQISGMILSLIWQWILYFLRRCFLSFITAKTFTVLDCIWVTRWVPYKKQELFTPVLGFFGWWGPCCSSFWKEPERTTDHGQATGKLYHLWVECTLFCNLQSRTRTHTVLVIGLYELVGTYTWSENQI